MKRSLSVIYATSTGHTEFVVDTLIAALAKSVPDLLIKKQRAETAKAEDLTKESMLLLACGSWNTGNVEGQLQPQMHELLMARAGTLELKGMPVAAIGLGDERYYFTAKAADKLTDYLSTHGGKILLPTLKVVNEPFDQVSKVEAWAKELATAIKKLPVQAD